jgi:hypothetical protein
MKSSLMVVLLLALLGLSYRLLTNPDMGGATRVWVSNLMGTPEAGYGPDQIKVDIVDRINYQRTLKKQSFIHVDSDLERWMESQGTALSLDDIDGLPEKIRDQHPRYFEVATGLAGSNQLKSLVGELDDFISQLEPETTHIAAYIVKAPAGLGYKALVVAGQKLTDFSPEALSERKVDVFFSKCPHCSNEHACRISSEQRGINLECRKCSRSYGVLAADENGQFRYVNEFLTGYSPPAHFPYERSQLHEMYTIWSAVVKHCTYVKDTTRFNTKRDAWQTALETQTKMRGDCEDSSVFLADWLLSKGLQVRVALGHYGDMGGHAWCVAKVDGVDYLLESTEGPPNPNKPPYVTDLGSRYVPDTLFDRDAIYVRSNPREKFNGDYWSTKHWTRIQPRLPAESAIVGVGSRSTASPALHSPPLAMRPSRGKASDSQDLIDVENMKGIRMGQLQWNIPVTLTPEPEPTAAKPSSSVQKK